MAPVTRSALHRSADEKSSSTRRGKKVLPVAQPSNNGRGRRHSVATKSSSVGKGKKCYLVDMEMDKCWWLERSPVWKKFKTTVKGESALLLRNLQASGKVRSVTSLIWRWISAGGSNAVQFGRNLKLQ